MPNPGAFEVGQRRFWNALGDHPGIIYIQHWSDLTDADLYADGELVYTGAQLNDGPLPFPVQFKTARIWEMRRFHLIDPNFGSTDFDCGQWYLQPYTTVPSTGPDNLLHNAIAMPTTLHYVAHTEFLVPVPGGYWPGVGTGFGAGGLLYGYLNNVYFGNNEYGGGKENVGIGPKYDAVGDMSKLYIGFWGQFGLSHGVAPGGGLTESTWTFDLCDRSEAMATSASLSLQNQSEGWGTDIAPVSTDATGHRIFTLFTSPARGTLNVYTPKGLMLMKGLDWDNAPGDTTGLVYRLLRDISGPCEALSRVVVTYLVLAPSLRQAKSTTRITDTNVGSNRLDSLDIRGL
jgi:hypothetical protein